MLKPVQETNLALVQQMGPLSLQVGHIQEMHPFETQKLPVVAPNNSRSNAVRTVQASQTKAGQVKIFGNTEPPELRRQDMNGNPAQIQVGWEELLHGRAIWPFEKAKSDSAKLHRIISFLREYPRGQPMQPCLLFPMPEHVGGGEFAPPYC